MFCPRRKIQINRKENRMKRATMLALMVLGAISLFTTAPAFAADYNGNCAGAANWSQTDGQGNVTITDTSCVISGPVTASGHIWISATTIQAQALTANGGPITLTGNGGTTTGALSATAGNVWVDDSGGSVTLGSVTQPPAEAEVKYRFIPVMVRSRPEH